MKTGDDFLMKDSSYARLEVTTYSPHTPFLWYGTSPETLDGIKSSIFKMLISIVVPILKKKIFFMLNAFLCTLEKSTYFSKI